MKIIFLDIDGVLATHLEYSRPRHKFQDKYDVARTLRVPYPFNAKCVEIFNEILEKTGAEIVLSSDWRMHWDLEELDQIFKLNGVIKSPIDVTHQYKRKMSSSLEDDRGHQILTWIEKNNPDIWVAIDDLKIWSFDPEYLDKFFLTRDQEGLKQLSLKDKIIKKLNHEQEQEKTNNQGPTEE